MPARLPASDHPGRRSPLADSAWLDIVAIRVHDSDRVVEKRKACGAELAAGVLAWQRHHHRTCFGHSERLLRMDALLDPCIEQSVGSRRPPTPAATMLGNVASPSSSGTVRIETLRAGNALKLLIDMDRPAQAQASLVAEEFGCSEPIHER